MRSKTTLLAGVPAVLGLALAGLAHPAAAAPTPPRLLFTVSAAAGYYQVQTDDGLGDVNPNPAEAFVVAVKDRANNPIANATVTFAAPGGAISIASPVAPYANNGLYVLPATINGSPNLVVGAAAPNGPLTLVATATVPTASGTLTLGTASFTVQVNQQQPVLVDPFGDGASLRYVYSPATNPLAPAPPQGAAGSTAPVPAVQAAQVSMVYPFQDEVQVLNAQRAPVSGALVRFAIADTSTPPGATSAAFVNNGVCSGQVCTITSDSEGIARAEPVQSGSGAGTFAVTASLPPPGQGLPPPVGLAFNYVVASSQTPEVCQVAISAFISGGSDAIGLHTSDQGPEVSLNTGTVGPISPGSPISNPAAQNFPLSNSLGLGLQGAPNVVNATPLVPSYYDATPATRGDSTMACTVTPPTTTGVTPIPAPLITVTATFNALVTNSVRAGVSKGDVLAVTITKAGYLLNARGMTQVASELVQVVDATTGGTVLATPSIGPGPQTFLLKLDNTLY